MCSQELSECVACRFRFGCHKPGHPQTARRLSGALARRALARPPLRFTTSRKHWRRVAALAERGPWGPGSPGVSVPQAARSSVQLSFW
jgi:hypothetical protein